MLQKLCHQKNNNGFSLLEVIISIAILALLSGYVLQSFILSDNLNKKAADLDKTTALCVSYIEEFKASPIATLKDKYQNIGENEWEAASYYDNDWESCDKDSIWTYRIISVINKHGANTFSVTVSAEKADKNGHTTTIASLETQKYLPEKAVE